MAPLRIPGHDADAITVSLHCENNFPARKAQERLGQPLPRQS